MFKRLQFGAEYDGWPKTTGASEMGHAKPEKLLTADIAELEEEHDVISALCGEPGRFSWESQAGVALSGSSRCRGVRL